MVAYGKTLKDRALAKVGKSNGVGWCQLESRKLAGLPSAFDFDGNDRAAAADAWKKSKRYGKVIEAKDIRHPEDVPAGTIAYYLGGSQNDGHAAPTVGGGDIVSTDADGPGRWAKVGLLWPEHQWGMKFVGFIVTYFDGSKMVAQSALPAYLRDKQSAPKPPQPGVYLMKKKSIRTFQSLNADDPMDDRTHGPVVRKIRQVRISDADGIPRGRVRPRIGRWYQLTPDRAKRLGNL